MAYVEIEQLEASDHTTNDVFGSSVAFSSDGSVIVVGAPIAGTGGQVYVYSGSGWGTETILVGSDTTSADSFGRYVACSEDGSVIVVGAPFHDVAGNVVGQAYVYSGASWGTETILTASDASPSDQFGFSVACSSDGSVAVVGAIEANASLGQAYVYSGASWGTETILLASDRTGGRFGWSVACSGDESVIAVGATAEGAVFGGQVYLYTGASWGTETILVASDSATDDQFGYAVACSDDGATVVTGAPFWNGAGTNYGKAYAYSGTSWANETSLTSPSPGNDYRFGWSVDCSDDATAVVVGQFLSSTSVGVAFAYTGTGWADIEEIARGSIASLYSYSISCSGDAEYVAVGAPQDDAPTSNEGRVYVYGPGFVPQIYRRL